MKEQQRQFKGIWIPKEIWLNKELTQQEKTILVEIDSYDDGQIGCYASNKHFMNNFGMTSTRVSQVIQSLQRKGYITINYEYNGKEIEKRFLHIKRPPYPEKEGMLKNDIGMSKNEMGVCQFPKGGYVNFLKDNNTIYNNTNNNNIIINIYDYIQENFGRTLSPAEYEEVREWKDNELTRYAIKQAVLSNKCGIKYISRILNSYERENVKTVQQAQERERIFIENKKESKKEQQKSKERDAWENE